MQRNLAKIWHRCGIFALCQGRCGCLLWCVTREDSLAPDHCLRPFSIPPQLLYARSAVPGSKTADATLRWAVVGTDILHGLFRFVYGNIPLFQADLNSTRVTNQGLERPQPSASLPDPFEGDYQQDDAWSTILQWLSHRAEQIKRQHP